MDVWPFRISGEFFEGRVIITLFFYKIAFWHCRPCYRILQVNSSKRLNIKALLWLACIRNSFQSVSFKGVEAPSSLVRNSGRMNHQLPDPPGLFITVWARESNVSVSRRTGSPRLLSPSPFSGGRSHGGWEGSDITIPDHLSDRRWYEPSAIRRSWWGLWVFSENWFFWLPSSSSFFFVTYIVL